MTVLMLAPLLLAKAAPTPTLENSDPSCGGRVWPLKFYGPADQCEGGNIGCTVYPDRDVVYAKVTCKALFMCTNETHSVRLGCGGPKKSCDCPISRVLVPPSPPSAETPLFVVPPQTERVWVEVGVFVASDFSPDLHNEPKLFYVGVEPTAFSAASARFRFRQLKISDRSVVLRRACTQKPEPKELTFYLHDDAECNTLLQDNPSRAISVNRGRCIGNKARAAVVETVTLGAVIDAVPSRLRIQLLKLDVQGNEWPCIQGATVSAQLQRVDNIFVELQDVPPEEAMYEGSLNVGGMDERLGKHGFARQYCELQSATHREINCLYTQRGRPPLWVNTNLQAYREGASRPSVATDTSQRPWFHRSWPLLASSALVTGSGVVGALDERIAALGILLLPSFNRTTLRQRYGIHLGHRNEIRLEADALNRTK